jgi:hypothetical protein
VILGVKSHISQCLYGSGKETQNLLSPLRLLTRDPFRPNPVRHADLLSTGNEMRSPNV